MPIMLANVEMVLVDRNVVSTLSILAKHPDRKDLKANSWWMSHLNHDRFKLNAVLCAFEGRDRRAPTFEEFCHDLNEAQEILRQGLPNARLVVHEKGELDRVYSTTADFAARRNSEQRFLMLVAPLLADRVRRADARTVERNIFAARDAAGLSSQSLTLIAALSCLYENQDGSDPMLGRGIIKPRAAYTEAQAYNAVSDLQSLLYLALASAFGGPSFGLATRDKYLAAFWCALGISELSLTPATFNCKMVIRPALFPCLEEHEVLSLLDRMNEGSAS